MDIPRQSTNDKGRIQFIKDTQPSVKRYALDSKKAGTILDISVPGTKGRLEDTDTLLSWLANSVDMNPGLKKDSNLPAILKLIYDTPGIHFPEDLRAKARALAEKWEAENWGAPPPPDPQAGGGVDIVEEGGDNLSEEDAPASPTSRRQNTVRSGNTRIHYPPPAHPIWGQRGIFHGLAKKENLDTRFCSTVLNDRVSAQKRDPKIYGHNGLTVGQWFPLQLSALFHGAVGASQAGISGHTANGAYSIVVSGAYEDLDTDNGEVLYYSGSGSHENTDPKNARESTTGTKCLKASYHTGKPVRVMRTAKSSRYAPSCGIRYDGLYKVVSMNKPRNGLGGLYEQFRLVRLEDPSNRTLEECKLRPTIREVKDYGQREARYW